MKIRRLKFLVGFGLLICLAAFAVASTPSPFQPADEPLGLSVIAQTQLESSDTQSQAFQAYAPGYVSYIQQMLPESVAFTGAGLHQLDPQRLYFLFDYAPRVYYIYEGACYDNALGATIASVGNPTNSILTGNTFTIFPLVHSSITPACASGTPGVRYANEPVQAGDFVQLPTVTAGQQLSFFIMANMNSQGTPANVYYNGTSNNPDNFQHMVAFFPDATSQYIIIGFEDMYGGGDKDCNDLMFVVDVGPMNALVWRSPSSLPK